MTSVEAVPVTDRQADAAQVALTVAMIRLVVRLTRLLGVPMTDTARKLFAQRLYAPVQQARIMSYRLAVDEIASAATRADEPLPQIAPLTSYDTDALVKVLERATLPVEQAAADARSRVRLIDRHTGMPLARLGDPDDPRVVATVGENSGAAVARHVRQAGREAVQRTADAAGDEVGWARVTSTRPCGFCAMIASRGPVYRTDKTALYGRFGGALYHDHCRCRVVLVYRGKPWQGETEYQRLQQMWSDSTSGLHGRDAVNAFRRAVYADQSNPAPVAGNQ